MTETAMPATCDDCKRPMTARGCAYGYVATKHGEVLRRVRVGELGDFHEGEGRACHDCAAGVGKIHHPGCDAERCPKCGAQMLGCLGDPADDDDGFIDSLVAEYPEQEDSIRAEAARSCAITHLFTTKKEADRMKREQRETAKTLIDQATRQQLEDLEAQFRAPSHPKTKETEMSRSDSNGSVQTDPKPETAQKPKRSRAKKTTETSAPTAPKAETAAPPVEAAPDGDALTAALLDRVRERVPGVERVDAKSGAYFRLLVGKRVLGYVNPSKKGLILDLATPTDKVPAGVAVKEGPTAKLPVKFKVSSDADVAVAADLIAAIPADEETAK